MKSTACLAASAADGALATSLSVMPCIWLPRIGWDGLTNVDQRSLILPPLTLTTRDLEEVGHLRVGAGRLDVDDRELALGVDRGDEVEDRAGAGLEVRRALRLADGLAELLLDVDERLEGAVTEQDGLGHDVLGQELGAGLDHHDRVAGAGHDQVELRLLDLAVGRVDDELAADPADPDGADGAGERDLADRQRGRRGDRAEDVGLVLLVGREDRDDELDVVLVALGEERAGSGGRSGGPPGSPPPRRAPHA